MNMAVVGNVLATAIASDDLAPQELEQSSSTKTGDAGNDAGPNRLYAVEPEGTSFSEQIFNSLVGLKVAVSQYAMHLSHAERHRIFAELDSVINVDDWHEGDELPKIAAFQDFLKWMIYSKYNKWLSLGVSDTGHLLVAWKTPRVLLTGEFSGATSQDALKWTAQIKSDKGETGYTVGKCPLRLFASQALFYLDQAARHAA